MLKTFSRKTERKKIIVEMNIRMFILSMHRRRALVHWISDQKHFSSLTLLPGIFWASRMHAHAIVCLVYHKKQILSHHSLPKGDLHHQMFSPREAHCPHKPVKQQSIKASNVQMLVQEERPKIQVKYGKMHYWKPRDTDLQFLVYSLAYCI